MSYIIGWDIGGSHVKYAVRRRSDGLITDIRMHPMPLWRGTGRLERTLKRIWRDLPDGPCRHAVTMTAELADIYTTRRQGVREVVATLRRVAPRADMRFYGLNGFMTGNQADKHWEQIASANWHATAACVAARLPGSGLLVDIGGTTTDILPFDDHRPVTRGVNDQERLRHGELLYSGVLRTPLAALCDSVPYAGHWVRVCSEHFADTADVYRLLGWLRPGQDQVETADGGGKDREACLRRLARMIGADRQPGADHDYMRLAAYFAGCQLEQMRRALSQVLSSHPEAALCLVSAGCGAFLARRLAVRHAQAHMAFADLPGMTIADCLPNGAQSVNDCASAVAVALMSSVQSS